MRKIVVVILISLIPFNLSYTQVSEKYKDIFMEAEYYILYEDYAEALPLYLKANNLESGNSNIQYRIGLCYLNSPNEKHKAIPFLEKASKHITKRYREGSFKETKAPLSTIFHLGNAYRVNNQLDKAIKMYKEFKNQLNPKNVYSIDFVIQQIQNCFNAQELIKNPITIDRSNLGEKINTRFDNTNCIVSGDEQVMVYTSRLKFYDAVFFTTKQNGEWNEPKNITSQLRTEGKCYTTSLSYDGKILFIFLDDNYGGNIYVSYFSDEKNKWNIIEKLNKNINSKYWETHACISPDGQTLYFSSDRKGGYGGLDIYKSKYDTTSKDWGKAENLGPIINTSFNEESAYIIGDDELYFSSQGHFNMGGYDIFYTKRLEQDTWSEPLNLGYPINTTDDNIFFFPNQDGISAYYSDFDENGFGNLDIFLIKIRSEKRTHQYNIQGSIILQDNKLIYDKDKFEINFINPSNNKNIATIKPDVETGKFLQKVPAGHYTISFKGKGYKGKDKQLFIPENYNNKLITLNTELEPEKTNKEEFIVVKSIFFDFDDYSLSREALLEIERLYLLMNKYPSLYIEIVGHCDSEGAHKYNLELSKKRSRAVIDYLSNKGIEPERFIASGEGELYPIAKNKNRDGTDNPEGRKYNRRVDVNILNIDNELVISKPFSVPVDLKLSGNDIFTILLTKEKQKLQKNYFEKYKENLPYKIQHYYSGEDYFYTTGLFNKKSDAIEILNNAIDIGFENAEILDTKEIDNITHHLLSIQEKQKYKSNTFTIQLLATRNPVNKKYFKTLDVTEKKGKDNFYRYIYGNFKGYDKAKKQLEKIIQAGYSDAFVMNIEKYQ